MSKRLVGGIIVGCKYYMLIHTARGRGGGALPNFFFSVQQTTSGIGHRVNKVVFFGLATNTLNVRNNSFMTGIRACVRSPPICLLFYFIFVAPCCSSALRLLSGE